jgi:hypothetical protein
MDTNHRLAKVGENLIKFHVKIDKIVQRTLNPLVYRDLRNGSHISKTVQAERKHN